MMLYHCTGTSTVTVTYSGTTTATITAGNWCQCPNCGYIHDRYSVEYVRPYFDVKEEEIIAPAPASWPKPRSDVRPVAFSIARQDQPRHGHGRTVGHRGSFRNFHKLRD
jgi:hypothetical protein